MSNLKVYAKTIEDEALEQINTLLSQDATLIFVAAVLVVAVP